LSSTKKGQYPSLSETGLPTGLIARGQDWSIHMPVADWDRNKAELNRMLAKAETYQQKGDLTSARKCLLSAEYWLRILKEQGTKVPSRWTGIVNDALKSLDDLLGKKKEKKCTYRRLTDGEIEKLKWNGIDPEDEKGYDSRLDLFKCQGSGKVAIGRCPWHQDDDGEWQPGGDNFYDTCKNIDKMPWPKKGKKRQIMDETRIEFRIGGLQKPIDEILAKLPIPPDRIHRKGEQQGTGILTHKQDWFAYSAGDTKKSGFEKSTAALVHKLHPFRKQLQKVCGPHEARLSCVMYFAANHRPIVYFAPETIQKLNELGAAIDVDLFPLPSKDDED
jgi:hypothetical protein